jgi:transposase
MRTNSAIRFITPSFIVPSIGKDGAKGSPGRNTPRPMPRHKRSSKKLPELVCQEIARQADENRPVRLMFEDEARFGRIHDPRSCWAPAGGRPEVQVQVVREYEYVYGAVSPHDGVLETLVLPAVQAEAMGVFLAEVSRRHADEFMVMVLDGAGWHKAKRLQVPENRRLLFLPPWSPPLNPAEHLWDEWREKYFANRWFQTMDQLDSQLVAGLIPMRFL